MVEPPEEEVGAESLVVVGRIDPLGHVSRDNGPATSGRCPRTLGADPESGHGRSLSDQIIVDAARVTRRRAMTD